MNAPATPTATAGDTAQSLRRYLQVLEGEGRLLRFGKPVDVDQNLSALSYRTYLERAQGCLFSNVTGFPGWEVASQLVMDRDMWALALGVPETDVVETFAQRLAAPIAPQLVASAPVQEVVETGEAVDLMKIPAMWTSERDPGRYLASGMCIIKDPKTGIRNMSVHRAQILSRNTTGYYMVPRQAMRIHQMHQQLGRPMEAAMVIGGHPLLMFAAGYVAPYGVDELAIAGGLLRHPVRLVKCKTIDVEVPADAELVLEGEILPAEIAPEGPFGEVTGTYSKVGTAPVFRVKAVTRRARPVFYAMSCGMPPSDAHSITCAVVEARLSDHLKGVDGGLLDVTDIRCPGGMSPLILALRMQPRYPGQAQTALMAAAASPYLHPKLLLAADADVDISDPWQVLRVLASRCDPAKGMTRIDATRVFTLDNASPLAPGVSPGHRTGTKVLFDATLEPRLDPAARAAHTWRPGQPAPAGRAEWCAALGVAEAGCVFTLRDRASARIAPIEAAAPALPAIRWEELCAAPGQALTAVLVLERSICLARVFRSGDALAIALDTPRLAALLGTRQRARLVLGAAPAVTLAAAIGSLGTDADYALAGSLAGAAVQVAGSGGLPWPVDAAAVIEGVIDPAGGGCLERVAGLTGFAGVTLDTLRFTVDACHGRHPADTPLSEPLGAIALANEILTARHLAAIEGGLELSDVCCPVQAGGLIVVVQLAARVAGQAKTALLAALSGPSSLARLAVAIDPDVDPADPAALIWAMASRVHAQSDIALIEHAATLPCDPLARPVGHGAAQCTRWIYDATIPLGGSEDARDEFARATPKNLAGVRLEDYT